MNEKINADLKSLKFIFDKNKFYVLPIVIMMVSIMLFFQFVIPQFRILLATKKEAKESSLKLEVLKGNLNVLTNINEEVLDSQLKVLNLALPLNKDFIGMLNSIYSTAQKTGISLGSFSFKVGNLSQSENGDNFPVIKLSAPTNASITAINSFVKIINKTVPLSEVYSVKVGDISSLVSLSFYYKPLGVSDYGQDVRISPISQKGLDLINKLNEFDDISSGSQPQSPVATSSAAQ
jgi:hypothetical protein